MVFFLHARWPYVGGSPVEESIGFVLLNLSRLAVPLFFLISGYLLKMKLEDQETPLAEWSYSKNFALKIGKYYVIGSVLFLGLKATALSVNEYLGLDIVSSLVTLDLQWPGILFKIFYTGKIGGDHLWFLLALFYAVLIVYIFYRYDYIEKLLIGAAGLHLLGILSRAYMVMPQLPIPRDDLIFFGLFFTVTGFYIREKDLDSLKSTEFFLGTAVLMNTLHLFERIFLTYSFSEHAPFFWFNYSLLTAPAALTVFLYLMKKKEFGKDWRVNRYGRKTLWIYILHPLALGILMGIGGILSQEIGVNVMENMLWTVSVTLVAYFVSSELIVNSSWRDKLREDAGKIWSRLPLA